jgi:hypothetical protein
VFAAAIAALAAASLRAQHEEQAQKGDGAAWWAYRPLARPAVPDVGADPFVQNDIDRFVLSAGHGSMLLYSLLHLTGYDLPISELQRFRRLHSRTPGHPEFGHTVSLFRIAADARARNRQ